VAMLLSGLVLSPLTLPLQYFNVTLFSDKVIEPSNALMDDSSSGDLTDRLNDDEQERDAWYDAWRSVPMLRRLVTAVRRVAKEMEWHKHVFMNALRTCYDIYEPEHSDAFKRGLLYYSDEVCVGAVLLCALSLSLFMRKYMLMNSICLHQTV
jgi:hypothetical protein